VIAQSERRIARRLAVSFVLMFACALAFFFWSHALPQWFVRDPSFGKLRMNNWQGSTWSADRRDNLVLCPGFLSPHRRQEQIFLSITDGVADRHDQYGRLQSLLAAQPNATGIYVHVEWARVGEGYYAPNFLGTLVTINIQRITRGSRQPAAYESIIAVLTPQEQASVAQALSNHWITSSNVKPPKQAREWALTQSTYSYKELGSSWWAWGTFLSVIAGVLLILTIVMPIVLLVACVQFYLVGRGWKYLQGTSCLQCGYSLEWLRPGGDGLLRCPECGVAVDTRSPLYTLQQ
jgi:hypothetical protein